MKNLLLSILAVFVSIITLNAQCTAVTTNVPTSNGRTYSTLPSCNSEFTGMEAPPTGYLVMSGLETNGVYTVTRTGGNSSNYLSARSTATGGTVFAHGTGPITFQVTTGTIANIVVTGANSPNCVTGTTWNSTSTVLKYRRVQPNTPSTPSVVYNCSPSENTVLSSSSTAVSGIAPAYQWQGSNDNSSWTNIGSATGTTYSITAATNPQYLYYRQRAAYGTCYRYSSSVSVVPRGNFSGNVTISSNITLSGTYTFSGNFTINSGVTVTTAQGCVLTVNATNINVLGTIDANGRGASGGNGGARGAERDDGSCSYTTQANFGRGGLAGTGTGAGAAGSNGTSGGANCINCGTLCVGGSDGFFAGGGGGGGGGGGSYGGAGGAGGRGANGVSWSGGPSGGSGGNGGSAGSTYGNGTDASDVTIGSGGAGGGGGGGGWLSTVGTNTASNGGNGGNGGSGVNLIASNDLTFSGIISANGTSGGSGGNGGANRYSGYDCNSCNVSCCGETECRDNDQCGACTYYTLGSEGGAGAAGGGGSGGGIKLQAFGNMNVTGALSAQGGNGGAMGGSPSTSNGTCYQNTRAGGAGGGGRIKIVINPCATNTITPSSASVAAGNAGAGSNAHSNGFTGNTGTYVNNITHPSYQTLTAGSIGSNQTICYNTTPSNITQATAAIGGINTYSYLWYMSTSNCSYNFSSYTGSTPPTGFSSLGVTTSDLASGSIGNLTTTTCFVRRVQSGSCYKWTNVVNITVYPDFNPGTLASGNETICPLGDPANIIFSSTPSGAAGTYTYQWYSRTGSVTCPSGTSTTGWTAIGGATSSSYNPPSGLTTTTTYAVTVNPTGTPDCGGAEWASNCRVVSVVDNTNPIISCPGNQTVNANASCQSILVDYTGMATASDNCAPPGTVTITQSPVAGTTISGSTNTITLTANDGNGNTASCTFNVAVVDNTIPIVNCKNITVQLNALGNASIVPNDVYLSGSDNCGTVNLVSVSPNSFNCSNVGANSVTLTVNDGNGNTNTCNATVTVVDNVNPSAVCQNYTLALDASGNGTLTTANINNGSSDACGIASLSLSKTAFTCSDVGINTVTLTVQDNNGNTSTCNASVTVTEAVPTSASAGNDDFICLGSNITLSGNTAIVGTGTWSWSGPGTVTYVSGTANTPNATVSFSTGGTYTGTWTITSNCSSSSDDVVIGVNLPDIITTTSGASGTCTSNGVNNWVHLFDNDGKIIASVDDNGQMMGNVTAAVPNVGNATASDVCGSTKINSYMGRYFRFFSTNVAWYGNNVNLRLYFTEAELASLIDESLVDHNTSPSISVSVYDSNGCQDDDDVRNINEIVATKYVTGTPPGSSGGVFITPTTNGYDATFQAYYVDVVVSSFSDIYLHGSEHDVPLPVELTSFTAKAINNQFITLNWTTATEINNEGFEILRSKDGINFERIGWANGYGNSAEVHHYSYQDNNVSVGTYYYQLKQIDHDGQYEYSDIRSASITGKEENYVGDFVPNPANNSSVLPFSIINETEVIVEFYDIAGKLIEYKTETLGEGNSSIPFNIKELASGTYTAKIILDGKVYTRRLIIKK